MPQQFKIIVDADACPVKDIIIKEAKLRNIHVVMVIDSSHVINDGYSEVITVSQGKDSADIKLINLTNKDDIVVTQDYGVAVMALGKNAEAINQNGLVYNNDNMDRLLFERHIGQKLRRSGKKSGTTKKRTKQNDEDFKLAFVKLLSKKMN